MDGFLKSAAQQVSAAADKAAAAAESKIGASGAEQVKKYGHEAADQIAHIDPSTLEGQLKSHGINIPGMGALGGGTATNATTAGVAAVPQTANATTGGVVTKLQSAVPVAAPADPAAPAAPEPAAATEKPVTPPTEPGH